MVLFGRTEEDTPDSNAPRGRSQGKGRGQGAGRGRMGGGGDGPGGECICQRCGKTVPHEQGIPCTKMTCPNCHTPMTRKR